MNKYSIITLIRLFLLLIVMNFMLFSNIGWAADLRITLIDKTGLLEDCQLLSISGDLIVDIENNDPGPVTGGFNVIVFEDQNNNGLYDPGIDSLLGSTRITSGVPAYTVQRIVIGIAGNLIFRGNLLYVFVDSIAEIPETDETNNYSNTGLFCEYRPPVISRFATQDCSNPLPADPRHLKDPSLLNTSFPLIISGTPSLSISAMFIHPLNGSRIRSPNHLNDPSCSNAMIFPE